MSVVKRFLHPRDGGPGSRGGVSSDITGDAQIMKLLGLMRQTSGRRTMTAGAANAVKQLAKDVKKSVPSRHKEARKSIGWRRLKAKEAPDGGAKVGASVGRRKSQKLKIRAGRKGVGISTSNIFWLFNDAVHNPRETKTTGRYTGVMLSKTNGIPSVKLTAAQSIGTLKTLFREGARKQLEKEIRKGKAF